MRLRLEESYYDIEVNDIAECSTAPSQQRANSEYYYMQVFERTLGVIVGVLS